MHKVIGVTGIMGSGKTTICKELIKRNKGLIYVNVDEFRLDLRNNDANFQKELFDNIKGLTKLEEINKYIYTNKDNMAAYKKILYSFLSNHLKEQDKNKVIIVDWALMIDDNLLDNIDKVLLVTCSNEEIYKRLDGSYWPLSEIKHRISLQLSVDDKVQRLKDLNKEYFIVNTEQAIDYDKVMDFILN